MSPQSPGPSGVDAARTVTLEMESHVKVLGVKVVLEQPPEDSKCFGIRDVDLQTFNTERGSVGQTKGN